MPRDEGGDRRSLRDEVIRLYEGRLPKGVDDERAGIWCRAWQCQLELAPV